MLYEAPQGLWLKTKVPCLNKVYIEPTNACNINCRTCVRNSWDEPIGRMDIKIYDKLIDELSEIPSLQKVSFWGFGEPLLHPKISEMVYKASQLGATTEIITNALLLDAKMSEALVSAGLDRIIISVDGTTPDGNDEIRVGSNLALVKKHVNQLREIRQRTPAKNPEIGIEFVLMRSNQEELKNLRRLAFSMGASFIIVTNLLPYTEELKDEILYANTVNRIYATKRSKWVPDILMPPMDFIPAIFNKLSALFGYSGSSVVPHVKFSDGDGYCRFIAEGSAVISWDGEVSPCIALMHSYNCFIMGREKHIKRYTIGNIARDNIGAIMQDSEFNRFRDKVQQFDFSPCVHCGGCDMAETNEEDCFGNTFPVCGDCLWAKGVIQCP